MKKLFIIIGIIIAVFLIAGISAYMYFMQDSLPQAKLIIKTAGTFVDEGIGYQAVNGEITVSQNSKIKTDNTGQATVVLYDSVILAIEPNTEITIKDLAQSAPVIEQNGGQVWTKFMGLAGVEQVNIEVGNALATVRGTFLGTGNNSVYFVEGTLEITMNGKKVIAKDLTVIDATTLEERNMTPEEKTQVVGMLKNMIDEMTYVRNDIIERHPQFVDLAMSASGMTRTQLDSELKKMDLGEGDPQIIVDHMPVKHTAIVRMVDITKKIAEQNKLIQTLE